MPEEENNSPPRKKAKKSAPSDGNGSPASKATPTKPATKSKTPRKKEEPSPSDSSFKVYNAPGMQSHPIRKARDMVRVLVRNPKEVYVFWEISEETFARALQDFGNPPLDQIQWKLKLSYHTPQGWFREEWFSLHPLSNSYYCNLHSPARTVSAELFADYLGQIRLFLEAKGGDLPPRGETREIDPSWIHPEWKEAGIVKQTPDGKWILTEEPKDPLSPESDTTVAPDSKSPIGSSFPSSPGSPWGVR